jgi:anti-sigma factor RsiW
MDCKKVREIVLTDYFDGELPETEKTVIEGHLAGCADCRAALEKVSAVSAGLREAPELKPDEAVWQKIQDRIETERERATGWFGKLADALTPVLRGPLPVFRVAFVAALIAIVVLITKWPAGGVDPAYAYIEEQMTFLGEIQAGNPELLNGDLKDYDAVFESAGK